MTFIELISNYRILMEHFNRTEYPKLFQKFQNDAAGCFDTLRMEEISEIVRELLDGLQLSWSRYRLKFRREAVAEDDKMLLLLFLIPSAVEYGTEETLKFTEELARQWHERFPDSVFRIGNYAEIQEGFRWKIKIPDIF